MNLEIKKKK